MKEIYKCEYCDVWNEEKNLIEEHEKNCGKNPHNKITDEMVIKLSRINERFKDSLIYVLIEDFDKKIEFYNEEFARATNNNCPASIYENKASMMNFLFVCECRKNEKDINYFKKITKRDNPELIEAIRTSLREPECRV